MLLISIAHLKHLVYLLFYILARDPDEVLDRYRRVLSVFKKKKSITAACEKVGVDRNTIALNAPIAELAIGAPD